MASDSIIISDTHARVALEPSYHSTHDNGYAAKVAFQVQALSGEILVELFDVPGFLQELKSLYESLTGTATLADHDGFALHFSIDVTGRMNVNVGINGWFFGVKNSIDFDIQIDQSYLPALSDQLRSAFPLIANAPRRAVTRGVFQ